MTVAFCWCDWTDASSTILPYVKENGGRARGTKREVKRLPGYDAELPSRTWTGFVETDAREGTHLFYYLIESERQDDRDVPLLVWMNGGPGASSLAGVFGENGPLLLNEEGEFVENPYSWSNVGHLLAIEFGPGIGFSYCANSSLPNGTDFCPGDDRRNGKCSPCYSSDTSVATQNAMVLETLTEDLFPSLLGDRPIYILGESYAGVYGPTLGLEMLRSKTLSARLAGLWITDPCTDNREQFGELDMGPRFARDRGLIADDTYATLNSSSCSSARTPVGDYVRRNQTSSCREAWRVYDLATAGIGNAVHPTEIPYLPMYIDPLNAYGPSGGGGDLQSYLSRDDVREALLGSSTAHPFPYFVEIGNNGYEQYVQEYAACNDHATGTQDSMIQVWRDIVDRASSSSRDMEILILNGDLDGIVGLRGTEAAVRSLGFPVAEARRPFFYNATAAPARVILEKPIPWGPTLRSKNAGMQIGGFVTTFDTSSSVRLRFVTIRNAGHMTPAYAPQKTLHTVNALIERKRLTPPLPFETLRNSSDNEFYNGMDGKGGLFAAWINQARGRKYSG